MISAPTGGLFSSVDHQTSFPQFTSRKISSFNCAILSLSTLSLSLYTAGVLGTVASTLRSWVIGPSSTVLSGFNLNVCENDLVHGWGMYMKLGYCAQGDRTRKVGVVDSEYIVHQGIQTLGGLSARKERDGKNVNHNNDDA
ncbi:hypothetical protein Vadar_031358 [Vaccinium darrowii]|uniref:Uncharacterized protein n=1 Tax=Vaccinium darrowii TaxID=229202 RepID=A0ACB7YII9_9ERIC|nr:hypothetical protein Vadar_031358 [Vaccinium darrowii]